MGIEKDIQQPVFKDSKQKAILNILFSAGWINEKVKNLLTPEDITPQQFNILRILRGSYPQPLSTLQIRERMLDRMSDTSRIVDRLVGKHLVKKTISARDRRLVDITITKKGEDLLQLIDKKYHRFQEIMSSLSDEEAGQLSNLLDKLRTAVA